MNFVIALPFTVIDQPLAVSLLEWINELGGCPEHEVLLVKDCKLKPEQVKPVTALAKKAFKKVWSTETPFALPDERWPLGPNHMFETALRATAALKDGPRPFLWLEPDCVPMRAGWTNELQTAWDRCQQQFMGQVVVTGKDDLPPTMLSGVAVYGPEALKRLLPSVVQMKAKKAFDVAVAHLTVPVTQHTRLVWNFHGEKELAPTFVEVKDKDSPRHTLTWTDIPKPTVLFHRCKDGSLMKLLRTKTFNALAA